MKTILRRKSSFSRRRQDAGPRSMEHQQGMAILATTILLLIGVTLITLSANRMGSLELNLSNIHESRKTAFNRADSGVDALFVNSVNIIDYNDPPGHVYCTTAQTNLPVACDDTNIVSPAVWPTQLAGGKNQAQIIMEGVGCPPRAMSTSCSATIFTHFTARSIYDDTANKGEIGRAHV